MGGIFSSRPTEMMAQIYGILVRDDGPVRGVLSTAKQVLAAGLVELAGDGSSAVGGGQSNAQDLLVINWNWRVLGTASIQPLVFSVMLENHSNH